MSVTSIADKIKTLLWVKAGGRCEYRGCNKSLYEDILTKKNCNQAYIAHIVADVPNGPRGCPIRSPLLKNAISNLMLLCDTHHRLIDKEEVKEHPESLLLEMKQEHEIRIEKLTSITHDMQSHIVIYRANVGEHSPIITYELAKQCLLPNYYPALNTAIDLGLTNSPQRDKDALFWQTELDVLQQHFKEKIKPSLLKEEIKLISLFAFAPMPLLIKLGTLLNDIYDVKIYQPIRQPKIWTLLKKEDINTEYKLIEPEKHFPKVALNISLSATINNDRITSVLGDNCSIYTLTIDTPFNDFLKSEKQLRDFSELARKLFDKIKSKYNAQTPLHIFPAMPIATSIELGRVWMPKADMPLYLYDENKQNGGFFRAFEIV